MAIISINTDELKNAADNALKTWNKSKIKEQVENGAKTVGDKANELKDAAVKAKDDIQDKITELDRELEQETTNYNDAYTQMNDRGTALFVERNREADLISNIENLINSIANRPKEFEKDFEEIRTNRSKFTESCEFADREIQNARQAASTSGAGLAAGASVAFMGPTAAMWVATTFGTASTGAAISTLSGAAASQAALAWLGGGTLAAGGGGVAMGHALLALAGPVGWTIAGATLMGSIIIYSRNKMKLNKEKSEEIEKIKKNIEQVRETDGKVAELLKESSDVRSKMMDGYQNALSMYNGDYSTFTDDQKRQLGALVNGTKTLSALLDETIA
ncbi:MAG: hypothetical protein ACOYA9_09395 [Bilifractor sp.]|jgi:hypothetical protein